MSHKCVLRRFGHVNSSDAYPGFMLLIRSRRTSILSGVVGWFHMLSRSVSLVCEAIRWLRSVCFVS